MGFSSRNDIRKRIQEHNSGLSKTTKNQIPWKVEVLVSFESKEKAQEFEEYLKGGSGYVFAKRHFWSKL